MPRKYHFSLKNKFLSEWQNTNKLAVSLCIITSLIISIYFALLSDSFSSYADFCLPDGAPPAFLLPFLWILGFLLLGLSAGSLFSIKEKCFRIRKKHGLLYVFSLFALTLLWSPVFFGGLFFFGVLIICIASALTLFLILELFSLRLIPSVAMLIFWLWLLFLLYLNLAVLFLN